MITCLLCSTPAVADGLCIADGARKWAADLWLAKPSIAWVWTYQARNGHYPALDNERNEALVEFTSPQDARDFLDRLDKAQEERKAAPCSLGCVSHEEER